VHAVDLSRRWRKRAGAEVPKDRPIDGVDQLGFLHGKDGEVGAEESWSGAQTPAGGEVEELQGAFYHRTHGLAAGEARDTYLFNLYTNPREDTKAITDSW